jgi:serine/threonine-protein kinase
MIYQLLCGRRPFESKDPIALMGMHVMNAPPGIRTFRPDIPGGVEDVLQRMLEKEPHSRFPHVKEAATALYQAAQASAPAAATALSSLEKAPLPWDEGIAPQVDETLGSAERSLPDEETLELHRPKV